MTLARITNFVNGNILTGPQLNNEFDNLYNNGPSLIDLALPKTTQVMGLTGSLISNIGSFAAQGYALRSTLGVCSVSATSSFSVNTQTPGPLVNGRDQAAAFTSTDVHFYAISTGGTSTAARGIVSSNPPPTGPTLPAGYSAWAYLVSAKYDVATSAVTGTGGSGSVIQGSRVHTGMGGNYAHGSAGPVAISSESLTDTVPQIAVNIMLDARPRAISATAGGIVVTLYAVAADAGLTFGSDYSMRIETTPALTTYTGYQSITVPNINTPPSIYRTVVINTGTSASLGIAVVGYSVPNGDVG